MSLDRIYSHPIRLAVVVLLLCVLASAGTGRLQVSDDIRDNLDPHSAALQAFNQHEKTFGATNSALLLIQYDGSVFQGERFSRLSQYTAWAEALPWAYRVTSIANVLVSESLHDEINTNPADYLLLQKHYSMDSVRQLILAEREVRGNLISADEKVVAIQILLDFDGSDNKIKDQINGALYQLRDKIRASEHSERVFMTGSLAIDHAQKQAVERNFGFLVPMVYLVMLVLLVLLLRSIRLMLLVIGCTALTIVAMLGLGAWLGIALSPISMNAISVLTGIVIAALCHVLVQVAQRMDALGYRQAVTTAMQLNSKPISLTAFTTIVAFLSLNLSEIPPLRDMGNLVALGTLLSLVVALFLFPALLLLWRVPIRDFTQWQTGLFRHYGEWLLRHGGKVSLVIAISSAVLLYAAQFNQVRDYFAGYFDKSFEFRVANDFADQHLSGLFHLEYTLVAKGEAGVTDVGYLQTLQQFADWLQAQPEVKHASTFAAVIERMNEVWHDNDPAWYKIPASNEEAAQFLLVYELSLPDTHSLTHILNLERTASRVVVNLTSLPSDQLFALEARAESWLQQHDTHLASYSVTGLTYMLTRIFTDATVSGLKSAVLAFLLIAGTLIVVFRSLPLGLVSLIPNVLPFGMALGIWAMINGDLVLTTSAVVTITLGIVVDDTIHFLHKVRYFVLEQGMAVQQAIIQTLVEVGPAIVITTVSIGTGFFLLVFSAFLPTAHFGILSTIILVLALILDLSLMPILLYYGRRFFFPGESRPA